MSSSDIFSDNENPTELLLSLVMKQSFSASSVRARITERASRSSSLNLRAVSARSLAQRRSTASTLSCAFLAHASFSRVCSSL